MWHQIFSSWVFLAIDGCTKHHQGFTSHLLNYFGALMVLIGMMEKTTENILSCADFILIGANALLGHIDLHIVIFIFSLDVWDI